MTTDWLPAESATLEKASIESEREVGGVRFKVTLSPYDIPQAVRSFLDDNGHVYIIELKYLTEEPTTEKIHNEFACIDVGQHSGRIYKIKVDMDSIKTHLRQNAFTQVSNAINRLSPQSDNRLMQCYDLARTVIAARQNDLSEPLNKFGNT
jgi:hypothetical protein